MQLWTRSGTVRSTTHWIENLEPNHKYQFRVIAENAQGRSKPSEPTQTVLTKGNFFKDLKQNIFLSLLFKLQNLKLNERERD